MNFRVFDGHSDIWTDVTIKRLLGEKSVFRNHHLERLEKGDIEGSIFVLWIDPPHDRDPQKRAEEIFAMVGEEIQECNGKDFVIVHNYNELLEAKREGKFYIIIGIEGLSPIGEDYNQLQRYYDFGARHLMLTWNEENSLATGVQGDDKRGLTTFGKKAINLAESLGMIVDVSHLNDRSFWDVTEVVTKPFVSSHANARAMCPAKRNLTDEQLKFIASSGGLVGINSFNLFVSPNMEEQTVENLVRQVVYMAEKIGVEHLGCGFDFFEFLSTDSMASYSNQDFSYTRGIEDATTVPKFFNLLKKAGFNDEELEQIAYKNWHRLIEKLLK